MATPPKKPAKAPATPRKAAAPAAKAEPAIPASNRNWKVIDTRGQTPEQAAQAIDQALQGKLGNVADHKAKKAASKVHNDVEKGSKEVKKGTEKAASTLPNVKSGAKSKGKSPADPTKTTRAPAREGKIKPHVAIDEPMIAKILAEVAAGKSLYKVCRGDDMPERVSVLTKFNGDPELRARWVAAMEARADKYAEETIDIADDGSNDTYVDAEGNVKTDFDVIARSKLRIDARKWYAGKLAPKYNDKVDVNHGVQPGNPIVDLLAQLAGTGFKPVA